ncbi:MAG: galactose mutarotase [Acholeplasmatales bacterium]|nr:galactose mutarotase [Acholeplasmatales bacterium]
MSIKKLLFGHHDQKDVYNYEIELDNVKATFGECGASIIKYLVKDKNGNFKDVVLGYDNLDGYLNNEPGFGAVVGRVANRIGKAKYIKDNVEYKLQANENENTLHSGYGYQYRIWNSLAYEDEEGAHMIFSIESEDMDQGFPGNFTLDVDYFISNDSSLTITYTYSCDKETPVQLTNHCYFNLNGYDSGSTVNHKLQIISDKVTKVDKELIATGEILDISNSAFDFRNMTVIKDNLIKSFEPYTFDKHFDINYVVANDKGKVKKICTLESDESGIGMNVYTDQPGVQFYCGYYLDVVGKNGYKHTSFDGLCFETQYFPNSVNHSHFPSPFIKAFEKVTSVTKYEFYIK